MCFAQLQKKTQPFVGNIALVILKTANGSQSASSAVFASFDFFF